MWDVLPVSVYGVQRTTQGVTHPIEWCEYWSLSTVLFLWLGWTCMGGCGVAYTESEEAKYEIAMHRLRT